MGLLEKFGGRSDLRGTAAYDKHRKAMADKRRQQTGSAQDIGEIPEVKDKNRRRKTWRSFRAFCETYGKQAFPLAWSADHLRVIAKIEHAVKHGDCAAIAMPRGSGKTTMCIWAVCWALVTGRHAFVVLVAAEGSMAANSMDSIKSILSNNDLLCSDYPEVCVPIRKLDGEVRRCAGQRYQGKLTGIEWGSDQIVLPTIPGSKASGGIVRTAGITSSRCRGPNHTTPDGRVVRPSLAIVDDPQTDETARSYLQTGARLKTIKDTIMGMGGPGKSCSLLVPCTVIVPGDLADQLLNRQENPQFRGEKTKAMYSMPKNMAKWDEYAKIQKEALIADRNDHPETEYYRANRAEMDEGAKVAWDARFDPHQISGLQFCMDKMIANPSGFAAEFQNEPLPEVADDDAAVSQAIISSRTNGLPRQVLPIQAQHVTGFIDVHDDLLYWAVIAWGDGFSGWVVDYGAWPDQHRVYWQHENPPVPLSRKYEGHGREAQIRQGLVDLTSELMGRNWNRVDGAEMRIGKLGIDTGYAQDQVYDVCRVSNYSGSIQPCRGVGIGATKRPMAEYSRHAGDRMGWHWYLTAPNKGMRTLNVDTNHWKSFLQARWKTPVGDVGSLSIFGSNGREHEFFVEHLSGEKPTKVEANGRTVVEWSPKPSHQVHWLDCVSNCACLASFLGVALASVGEAPAKAQKQRVRLSALQGRKG